jgi:hypothetical protein
MVIQCQYITGCKGGGGGGGGRSRRAGRREGGGGGEEVVSKFNSECFKKCMSQVTSILLYKIIPVYTVYIY